MTVLTMGPIWNLQSIIEEFRGITGRPDVSMMSDAQVAKYINYYYQYVLPKELKIFWGYTNYTFFTQGNVDQYTAPTTFQTLNPSVYADGFQILWYTDEDTFYQDYPIQINKQSVGNGDGVTDNFAFNISAYPVLPGSVYVTDGTQVDQDVPSSLPTSGGFVASPSGTGVSGDIEYLTGVVSVLSFLTAPAANTTITVSSATYMPNRPQAILFYRQQPLTDSTQAVLNAVNMFVLRPVPDQTYKISMSGIQIPQPLLNYTDVPFRPDLGPLIALGASLHVFKLFNQMDQHQQYMPEYLRFKNVSMQDTYEEYIYQRSIPVF